MTIVIFVVAAAILVASLVIHSREKAIVRRNGYGWDCDDVPPISIAGYIIAVVLLIFVFAMSLKFGNQAFQGTVIDNKIEMYEQENENIENEIDALVSNYIQHEDNVIDKVALNQGDGIKLVTLYPTLTSDELVSKQIDVYMANNQAIKDLKIQKEDCRIAQWWLYFGGGLGK